MRPAGLVLINRSGRQSMLAWMRCSANCSAPSHPCPIPRHGFTPRPMYSVTPTPLFHLFSPLPVDHETTTLQQALDGGWGGKWGRGDGGAKGGFSASTLGFYTVVRAPNGASHWTSSAPSQTINHRAHDSRVNCRAGNFTANRTIYRRDVLPPDRQKG